MHSIVPFFPCRQSFQLVSVYITRGNSHLLIMTFAEPVKRVLWKAVLFFFISAKRFLKQHNVEKKLKV